MHKKIYALITILLLAGISNISISQERIPVGVAGYVFDKDGNVVTGINVKIKNINTTEEKNVTTNSYGLYAVSIIAMDNDIIQGEVTYNNSTYYASIYVNTSKITQWLNISLVAGGNIPHCDFYYEPENPKVMEKINFHSISVDYDGYIVSWEWDFGDYSIGTGENTQHSYSSKGEYIVTLKVRDNDGLYASCSKIVLVGFDGEDGGYGNDTIFVPPAPPPLYPLNPYTIPEMYELIGVNRMGHASNGIKVAVIDTGVTHRIYRGYKLDYDYDLSEIEALKYPELPDEFDKVGHGTWCNFAVFYGLKNFTTNSKQYSIKVIDSNYGSVDGLFYALDLCKKMKVDVVSISLGGNGRLRDKLDMKIRELKRSGIIVVCAVGNYGPAKSTILSPALSPSAVGIGAIDPQFTINELADDTICEWSSRGPVAGLRESKPDVVAGGESIIGPFLEDEKVLSGTSMATPIVAGSCAVLYAKHKDLFDFIKKEYFFYKGVVPYIFESAIEKKAYPKGDKDSYGYGIPRFDLAEDYAVLLACLFIILLPLTIIFIVIIAIIICWYFRKRKTEKVKKKRG